MDEENLNLGDTDKQSDKSLNDIISTIKDKQENLLKCYWIIRVRIKNFGRCY